MYEVKVIEEFSSAHNLKHYKGKCEELHGHNWRVELSLHDKTPDKIGMIMDFKDLKAELKKILSLLDHKYLNDLPYFKKKNPTSENIAYFIHNRISRTMGNKKMKVSVWETPNSCASFEE